MASTSNVIFAATPLAGADLDSKTTTPEFKPLTPVLANDARKHVYARATTDLGSTANVTLGAAGSTTAAASAGVAQSFSVNTTGGVLTGYYFWARSNFL